jgi:hypothetical protein
LRGKVAITKIRISKIFLWNEWRVIPCLKIAFKNADRQSSNSYSHLKVQSHSIAMHLKEVIENWTQITGFYIELMAFEDY